MCGHGGEGWVAGKQGRAALVRRAAQRSEEVEKQRCAHLALRGGIDFALRCARVWHAWVLHARDDLREGAGAIERCAHPAGRRLVWVCEREMRASGECVSESERKDNALERRAHLRK